MKATALTEPYGFLDEEIFEVQYGVKSVVTEEKRRFKEIYTNYTIIGVVLVILSVVPLFAGRQTGDGSLFEYRKSKGKASGGKPSLKYSTFAY